MRFGYQKLGANEGGIRYDINSNSYIVWVRIDGRYQELSPSYGNGVDASSRLDDELLKTIIKECVKVITEPTGDSEWDGYNAATASTIEDRFGIK